MSQPFAALDSKSEPLPSPLGSAATVTPTQTDYAKTKALHGKGREREQQRLREREALEEKFATLFEPSTPRASPMLQPTIPNSIVDSFSLFDGPKPSRYYHSPRSASISSNSSSDFGSFVEATDDPLSFNLAQLSTEESSTTPTTSLPQSSRTWDFQPNSTLDFFDSFTHRAQHRSSAARSQVLDELLHHEDDPMWFVLESRTEQDLSKPPSDDEDPPNNITGNEPKEHDSSESILLEIDHDYFRPSQTPPFQETPRSNSPVRPLMPSRSSSAVAPPVACQLTASPPHSGQKRTSDFLEFDPLADNSADSSTQFPKEGRPLASSGRSASFNSLSSKLMLSLLRQSQYSPSLVSRSRSAAETKSNYGEVGDKPSVSATGDHVSKSASNLGQTLPITEFSSPTSTIERHATHPTRRVPFAPAIITHTTSPFAATFYSPPSGAPGFKGDRYDWDKGFSDELEHEWHGSSSSVEANNVHARAQSEGTGSSGVGSRFSGTQGRDGWGTGFRFGFGSVRAGKPPPISSTPSPSSSVLGPGIRSGGGDGQQGKVVTSQNPDTADWKEHHSGHDGQLYSSFFPELGTVTGMGDLIERKIGNVDLLGRRDSSEPVLMPEVASMLRAHLPALSRLPRSWSLIYSLDQHGISLNTLYSRCEAHLSRKPTPGEPVLSKGMLLAIKDATADEDEEHRAIFGAWIAEGLGLNKGKGYSGGGESFLWKYADETLKVFKTTGRNNYVALCEPGYLSFGGGDGHYGLYLDDTLFDGSSAPCPTFDNEPLCSDRIVGNLKTVKFECIGLEVWGTG